MKLVQVQEGLARLQVPEESFNDAFHLPVFYNPRMAFNREVSSTTLACALPMLQDSVVVDGLCATGSRGIRYALENKLKKVFFVDANPDVIPLLKQNIALNNLKRVCVRNTDLNQFFVNSKDFFDFVEIDPFGSAVPFLDNAFRKLKKKAVLSVTSTDLAKLFGSFKSTCRRVYDAVPLRTDYGHEMAARILLGKIVRVGASHDFAVNPLLTFYKDHYVKCFVLCEKSAAKADEALWRVGFWSHCFNCGSRSAGYRETCSCGKNFTVGGPMWLDKPCDGGFLESLKKKTASKQAGHLFKLLADENALPVSFFDLHEEAARAGKMPPSNDSAISLLKQRGFSACSTHFSGKGIKTNASSSEFRKAVFG